MGHWRLAAAGATAALLLAVPGQAELPLVVGGDSSARVEWSEIFTTPGDDWVNDLVPLKSGNILGVGFLGRKDGDPKANWLAFAAEMRPGGGLVAQHRYGEDSGIDAFWSAAELAGGSRLFAGFTTRVGPAGINGYVAATGANGALIAEAGFGGGGYDRFTDLANAGDGFIFVGHHQRANAGAPRQTYIVKTNAAGQQQWERIHGGPEAWSALYIEPAGDGGFVIAGGTDGGGDGDMFVLKVDAGGRELWRKRIGTPDWDEINHGLVVLADGRIVLVGYTHARGSEVNDLVAATLTADGEAQRIERFGGTGDDRAINGRAGSNGVIWVVGQTSSAGAGGADLLLTAYNPDRGFAGSAVTLGGAGDDVGTVVHPISGGALLVAGYSRNLGTESEDAFVARINVPAAVPNSALRRTVVQPR